MRRDSWSEDACPIARTMSILGRPWAALIVREALLGRSRFSEFREHLGVASDVLSARLSELVDGGILESVDYQLPGDRRRSRYVLTDAGTGLSTVLAAMGQWGREHLDRPHSCDNQFVDGRTGDVVTVGFRDSDDRPRRLAEVTFVERG